MENPFWGTFYFPLPFLSCHSPWMVVKGVVGGMGLICTHLMVTRMVAFFTCFYIFMQLSLHACLFAPPGLEPRRQQQQQPTSIAPSNAALSIDPADNFSSKGRQGPKSLGRAPQNTPASQHACSADARVAARAAGGFSTL